MVYGILDRVGESIKHVQLFYKTCLNLFIFFMKIDMSY